MSISLEALEQALSGIEQLGHDEITFDVGNTPLTMRTLSPEEEHAVQQYAAEAWTVDDNENASGETLAFVDRFRLDTIARAIVQVQGQDLRDVACIETGGKLANGAPIREQRHLVMRVMVLKWGGPVRAMVFKKYTEMLKKVEHRAEKAVEFDPVDIKTEIERLEARLQELKDQLEQDEKAATRTNPAFAVAEYGDGDREERLAALEASAPEPETTPEPPSEPAPEATQEEIVIPPQSEQRTGARQSIVPQSAPAPTRAPVQPPQPAPQNQPQVSDGDSGSFVGGDDLAAEVAAANQRLAQNRAQGKPLYAPAESALMAVHEGVVRPPHAGAVEAAAVIEPAERARQLAEIEADNQARLRGTTADGTEVFEIPAQSINLDPRATRQVPAAPLAPSNPGKGTLNPRFNPPSKM
jgi:hypothetical protein